MPGSRCFRIPGKTSQHGAVTFGIAYVASQIAGPVRMIGRQMLTRWAGRMGEDVNVTEKANILMVDDQPAKLLSYEAILGDLGENLIKARSGREALEQLLKHDVAVVL